jgi:hypothetical protein
LEAIGQAGLGQNFHALDGKSDKFVETFREIV